ncbi:MAG: hypothetical protein WC651_03820 [Candidatus Gracilibacteria bacterium]|jgi:hypothetical protein
MDTQKPQQGEIEDKVSPLEGAIAGFLGDTLEATRRKLTSAYQTVGQKVDDLVESPSTPAVVREAAKAAYKKTGRSRLTGRINFRKLPPLLANPEEDKRLKIEVIEASDMKINAEAPFYEEIAAISKQAFAKGVPPEVFIAFLESDEMLDLLIEETLEAEFSRYTGLDIPAMINSVMESIVVKLQHRRARSQKEEVPEETREQLERRFRYFRETYNPKDPEGNMSGYLRETRNDFGTMYDIDPWLKGKKEGLKEILKGHIPNMVNEAYETKARESNKQEEYIRMTIGKFFYPIATSPYKQYYLDGEELGNFFRETLIYMRTSKTGTVKLREQIINECFKLMETNGKISIHADMGAQAVTTFCKTPKEARKAVERAVKGVTTLPEMHIDLQNLFVEPKAPSEAIERDYKTLFDEGGELKSEEYKRMLRNLFEATQEKPEQDPINEEETETPPAYQHERLGTTKARVRRLFKEANTTIQRIAEEAGVDCPEEFEEVFEINDYAELIKMAYTAESERVRVAARYKIETAWLTYLHKFDPRFVYRERDAKQTAYRLENMEGGITIRGEKTNIRGVELIPVTVGGVDCYVLPTKDEEYLGTKSLYSLVAKSIRRSGEEREENVTDILRMTFVVENKKDIESLDRYIAANQATFGRTIKRKKYGETVAPKDKWVNDASSGEYKTDKSSGKLPVASDMGETYHVTLESRVITIEDAIGERSPMSTSDARHEIYVRRRGVKCAKKIFPYEIFPEMYNVCVHPDDTFKRRKIKLRTKALSTVSSAPSSSETQPQTSPPASS